MVSTLRNRLLLGIGLFLLACLPRFASVLLVQCQTYSWDGQNCELDRAALNIAREGYLGNVFGPDTGPSAHVAPLYAYWLAIWYALFGPAISIARLVQGLFAVGAVSMAIALLPELGRKLRLPAGPTLAAAVVWGLFSFNFAIETTGCWEQAVLPLMLIGLTLLFTELHEKGWRSIRLVFGGGCLVGLAALVSPVILPVVGGFLVVEVFQARAARRPMLMKMALLFLVALGCIAPWTYRNYRVLGGFVPIRSNFGLELALGNGPGANGKTFTSYPRDPACLVFVNHPFKSKTVRDRLTEQGELAFMQEKRDVATTWITAHPEKFAQLTLARFRYFWFPPGCMWADRESDLGPSLELQAAFFALLTVGCFGWLAFALWRRLPSAWTFLVLLVGPSLPYMITHVHLRYRYPIFGFSLLLCCQFLFLLLGPLAGRLLSLGRTCRARPAKRTSHPFAPSLGGQADRSDR